MNSGAVSANFENTSISVVASSIKTYSVFVSVEVPDADAMRQEAVEKQASPSTWGQEGEVPSMQQCFF